MFASNFDRFAIISMLGAIATDLHASLAQAAAVASAYFLAYGLAQLPWGLVSDRIGRVPTMRLTLFAAGVVGLASAAAPSLAKSAGDSSLVDHP